MSAPFRHEDPVLDFVRTLARSYAARHHAEGQERIRMHGRRAAIYARYSTELQDGRSIDDQVALCREHAARSGLTVVATYDDRAKTSASIFGRDGLARMMEQARARQFDVVIVEALDRLSRDQGGSGAHPQAAELRPDRHP